MKTKVNSNRAYTWLTNTCVFAVAIIAVAYDRMDLAPETKAVLFWSAIGFGVVSFVAYVQRRRKSQVKKVDSCSADTAARTVVEQADPVAGQNDAAPTAEGSESGHSHTSVRDSASPKAAQSHTISANLVDHLLAMTAAQRQRELHAQIHRMLEQYEQPQYLSLLDEAYARDFHLRKNHVGPSKANKNLKKFGRPTPVAQDAPALELFAS